MKNKEIDFKDVKRVYLTNNSTFTEKTINENYGNEVSIKNLKILKDHLTMDDLASYIYSFFEYEGGLYLGIGQEGSEIDYTKVTIR